AWVHLLQREPRGAQQHAESTIRLCAEHKFANFLGQLTIFRGWALAEQGSHPEGIAEIRQGLAACRATGAGLFRPSHLAFLADSCRKGELTKEGLSVMEEAFAAAGKTGERFFEAELYRLKGALTLQFKSRTSPKRASSHQPATSDLQPEA